MIVACTFVLVSVAHACPDLAPVKLGLQQITMNMETKDEVPCGDDKSDLCKSVRDSILSVKPSDSASEQAVPQLHLAIDAPLLLVPTSVISIVQPTGHPVFNFPLSLSYLALRI